MALWLLVKQGNALKLISKLSLLENGHQNPGNKPYSVLALCFYPWEGRRLEICIQKDSYTFLLNLVWNLSTPTLGESMPWDSRNTQLVPWQNCPHLPPNQSFCSCCPNAALHKPSDRYLTSYLSCHAKRGGHF